MKENNCALRDYIREIVREEIAAHEERLKEESFAHVGKRLAEQNRAIGIQGFCDTPEQP